MAEALHSTPATETGDKPRILYISRHHPDTDVGWLTRMRRHKTRYLKFRGQCGFMRSALHRGFRVREADLAYLQRHKRRLAHEFDYLMVCSKSDSSGNGLKMREFDFIADIEGLPKAFFVSNPEAGFMPDDACLDRFDIVFKREHYADLDRYRLSPRNRDKIRLAWLACPLIDARRTNIDSIVPRDYGFADVSRACDVDVCFYGTHSSPIRPAAWRRLLTSDLSCLGGIQPHDVSPEVAADVYAPPVDTDDYIASIRRARINIALEGLGEFTHRHWELWLLCAFCLSSPVIRDLALPGGAREGEHFVCWDDFDDMIDKARHYAMDVEERHRIARNGRGLFEEIFDFDRYADFVRREMDTSHDRTMR